MSARLLHGGLAYTHPPTTTTKKRDRLECWMARFGDVVVGYTFRCALKNMSKINNALKVCSKDVRITYYISWIEGVFNTLYWSLTFSFGRNGVGMSLNRMSTLTFFFFTMHERWANSKVRILSQSSAEARCIHLSRIKGLPTAPTFTTSSTSFSKQPSPKHVFSPPDRHPHQERPDRQVLVRQRHRGPDPLARVDRR